MSFDELQALIPQYLAGELTGEERKHLKNNCAQECANLRIELEELRSVWQGLGLVGQEQPSAACARAFTKGSTPFPERSKRETPARRLAQLENWRSTTRRRACSFRPRCVCGRINTRLAAFRAGDCATARTGGRPPADRGSFATGRRFGHLPAARGLLEHSGAAPPTTELV
jgi:hypothetical protein